MRAPLTHADNPITEVETTLFASDTYIETLTIKPLAARPWLTEVVIKTQLLTAKNPLEKRVKVQCFIGKEQLIELRDILDHYLTEPFKKECQQ